MKKSSERPRANVIRDQKRLSLTLMLKSVNVDVKVNVAAGMLTLKSPLFIIICLCNTLNYNANIFIHAFEMQKYINYMH